MTLRPWVLSGTGALLGQSCCACREGLPHPRGAALGALLVLPKGRTHASGGGIESECVRVIRGLAIRTCSLNVRPGRDGGCAWWGCGRGGRRVSSGRIARRRDGSVVPSEVRRALTRKVLHFLDRHALWQQLGDESARAGRRWRAAAGAVGVQRTRDNHRGDTQAPGGCLE